MHMFLLGMQKREGLREQPFDNGSPCAARGLLFARPRSHPDRCGAHLGHGLFEARIERDLATLFGALCEADPSVAAAGFTG